MSEKVPGIYASEDETSIDEADVMESWLLLYRERRELEQKLRMWDEVACPTATDLKLQEDAQAEIRAKLNTLDVRLKSGSGSQLPSGPAPTSDGAQPAPQPVPVVQPEAIDFGMLATPEQLINTFGNHTGMCKAWFSNLTDTPRLLIARKVAGTGGKHHTPPLFCPFEVMQWLIDEKRKKGRKVSPEKAWQLLQSNFEKVYNTRSAGDPR